MNYFRFKLLATAASLLCLIQLPAYAGTIVGLMWLDTVHNGTDASPATVSQLGSPGATFLVNVPDNALLLNFDLEGNSFTFTRRQWLATGGATGVTDLLPGFLDNPMNRTVVELFGTADVVSGDEITVSHDDGVWLQIDGDVVINRPGPGGGMTSGIYNGPTGDQPFSLIYAECCGGPARLITPAPAPEPVSAALLGTALIGLTLMLRRRKDQLTG